MDILRTMLETGPTRSRARFLGRNYKRKGTIVYTDYIRIYGWNVDLINKSFRLRLSYESVFYDSWKEVFQNILSIT